MKKNIAASTKTPAPSKKTPSRLSQIEKETIAKTKTAAKKEGDALAAALIKKITAPRGKKPSTKKSLAPTTKQISAALKDQGDKVIDAMHPEFGDPRKALEVPPRITLPAKTTPVVPPVREVIKINLPPKEGEAMQTLSIFGPNLESKRQNLGQFHIHTQDCKDCKKLRAEKANEYVEAHASYESVARSLYKDQIAEGLDLADALADLYFAPCVKFAKAKTPLIPPAPAPAPVPAPAPAPKAFALGDRVLMDGTTSVTIVSELPKFGYIIEPSVGVRWSIISDRLSPMPKAKKRYEAKTEKDSSYHNPIRSTCEKPIAVVKRICAENPGVARKIVLAKCVAAGVNPSTAATQYSLWKVVVS